MNLIQKEVHRARTTTPRLPLHRVLRRAAVALLSLMSLAALPAMAQTGSLACSANEVFVTEAGTAAGHNVYRINGTTGASPSLVVTLPPPGGGSWNGMGVSLLDNIIYSVRSAAAPHGEVLAYNLNTNTYTVSAVPAHPGFAGGFVAGGVNPANNRFYSAVPAVASQANTTFALFVYDASMGTAAPTRIGTITGIQGNNGDLAFDGQGNLYLLAGNVAGPAPAPPRVYRANAADVSAGAGAASLIPATAVTGVFTGGINYGGLAFANGEIIASSGTVFQRFNPSSGTQIGSNFTSTINSIDLASCQPPSTIRLQKNLPSGRAATGDQFTLSITGGELASGNTATTTSTSTGLQTPIAGPVLGLPNTSFTISETASGTTTLGNYASSWQCVNTSSGNAPVGSGPTLPGSFTMPSGAGNDILCTITNTPATLTLQKTWVGATVNNAVNVSVTTPATGTTLNSVANTASETDVGTAFNVTRGTAYTITEAFTTGAPAGYAKALTCTGNSGAGAALAYTPNALSGTVTIGSTATNVVCTFTNTRLVGNLQIAKTGLPASAVTGGLVDYTITVTNSGTIPVTGAQLLDTVPAGLDCLTAPLAAPTCTGACPGAITAAALTTAPGLTLTTMAPAAVTTITLQCRVTATGQ